MADIDDEFDLDQLLAARDKPAPAAPAPATTLAVSAVAPPHAAPPAKIHPQQILNNTIIFASSGSQSQNHPQQQAVANAAYQSLLGTPAKAQNGHGGVSAASVGGSKASAVTAVDRALAGIRELSSVTGSRVAVSPHVAGAGKRKAESPLQAAPQHESPVAGRPGGRPRIPGPAGDLPPLAHYTSEAIRDVDRARAAQYNAARRGEARPEGFVGLGVYDPMRDPDFMTPAWRAMLRGTGLPPYPPATARDSELLAQNVAWILKNGYRKRVKFLAVVVTTFRASDLDAAVTLKDPSGEIQGSVQGKVLRDYPQLNVGAVLLLSNVSIFSPTRTSHYVNVTEDNLAYLFPANMTDPPPVADTQLVVPTQQPSDNNNNNKLVTSFPPSQLRMPNPAPATTAAATSQRSPFSSAPSSQNQKPQTGASDQSSDPPGQLHHQNNNHNNKKTPAPPVVVARTQHMQLSQEERLKEAAKILEDLPADIFDDF